MKAALINATICATAVVASAQKPYSAPRTPWGHPDLQATWTTDDARSVPLQRAPELGERRLLTDQEYRRLQELGEFDARTSSWLWTPPDVRSRGGAIFGDYRFGRVFIYHNGAESYYAARGFRCVLRV